MANIFSKLLRLGDNKQLKEFEAVLEAINGLDETMTQKSDAELRSLSDTLRERAVAGEQLDALLPEAFALMRESSSRVIGLRHYDVQLIGAMALHSGSIAEMKTGEGKTLVSTAAGYLNALSGNNVHVVTVNDYLAKRDSEWMGQVYEFLGMHVGLVQNGMFPFTRKHSYAASVTYGTNSEFGFDYLKDNMVGTADERVQRGHTFAIVDEVDSILIDEARTPLIISGSGSGASEMYRAFSAAVRGLKPKEDFVRDEAKRTIFATEDGLDKIEDRLGVNIYTDLTGKLANHLKQALQAEYLFKRDDEYAVIEGELKIVDQFTGRIMEGRRYSEGLHQALEAKEGLEIKDENQTLATITLQNYFRLYEKLSGMTGTALTEDAEFRRIYNLPVIPIPTNKPVVREDKDDFIFRTIEKKYEAVANEVERRSAKGQPVLIGTTSIESSETLSKILEKRGIKHETLNAKNPEREAHIVAQAGRRGAVTIATNMAGRGTDILLGGSYDVLLDEALARFGTNRETASELHLDLARQAANYELDREGYAVRMFGGLFVIGTERHEARRIDNQLRGRAGRQGDPGESQFFLSLEDKLLRLFGQNRLGAVSDMMEKRESVDDSPIQDSLVSKVIGSAQRQIESVHFSARKNVLEYDDVMNLQREAIYNERNMLLDGKQVDDSLTTIVSDVVQEAVGEYCPANLPSDDWDTENLQAWLEALTGLREIEEPEQKLVGSVFDDEDAEDESDELEVEGAAEAEVEAGADFEGTATTSGENAAEDALRVSTDGATLTFTATKIEEPVQPDQPAIKYVEVPGFDIDAIDHDDDTQVLVDAIEEHLLGIIAAKREALGEEAFKTLESQIMLHIIDTRWIAHLQDMEYLKGGIGLRAVGQRDPLVEYKEEAYNAFGTMTASIYEDFLLTVLRLPVEQAEQGQPLVDTESPYKQWDAVEYSDKNPAPQPAK